MFVRRIKIRQIIGGEDVGDDFGLRSFRLGGGVRVKDHLLFEDVGVDAVDFAALHGVWRGPRRGLRLAFRVPRPTFAKQRRVVFTGVRGYVHRERDADQVKREAAELGESRRIRRVHVRVHEPGSWGEQRAGVKGRKAVTSREPRWKWVPLRGDRFRVFN